MGAGLENVNISYILSYAKCDLKLSIGEQGVLTSVSFLGIVSTSYFWGFLADVWGRQKVLSVAALTGFCFSFTSAFATNTSVLIALRFLSGSFLAGSQAGAFSYISGTCLFSFKKCSVDMSRIYSINNCWFHIHRISYSQNGSSGGCFFVNNAKRSDNCFIIVGHYYTTNGMDVANIRLEFHAMAFFHHLQFIHQLVERRCVLIFARKPEISTRHQWKRKSSSSTKKGLCIQYWSTGRGMFNLLDDFYFSHY